MTGPRAGDGALRSRLDRLYARYDASPAATADPVHVARRFPDPADREVVAFLSAALAFGRVQGVIKTIERVLALMAPTPHAFVRRFDPAREARRFDPVVHRWTRGDDIAALLLVLRAFLEAHGSLEAAFLAGYDPGAPDLRDAIERFSARAMALDLAPIYGRRRRAPGVGYFFPRPSAGSACKRLNLFLRWMVRRDGVDLGLWRAIPPSKLVVPLDTHVIRVSRCLGLTRYRSPGWAMAADITASLRRLDPRDPVRYDFALCHVGMRYGCGVRCAAAGDACPLAAICRGQSGTRPRSRPPSARR